MQEEVEREIALNKEKRSKSEAKKELIPLATIIDPKIEKDATFKDYLPKAQAIGISEAVLRLVMDTQDLDTVIHGLEYTLFEAQRGKIKDSIDGYFISAVKGKFTNAAFEKDKQGRVEAAAILAKKAEKSSLKKDMDQLQDLIFEKQNALIKELIAQDAAVTPRALAQAAKIVQKKPNLVQYVQKKGWILADLDLAAWRKDKILRGCVIETIVTQHQHKFEGLAPDYDTLRDMQSRYGRL